MEPAKEAQTILIVDDEEGFLKPMQSVQARKPTGTAIAVLLAARARFRFTNSLTEFFKRHCRTLNDG